MDIFNVLDLIGGLALFLYGMNVMGNGLSKMAGGKLESILQKVTTNRFYGVLLGAFVTSVIQSSSATTVMVVGFVNSGIMELSQAVGVIMGANIGTTITSWMLSLTGISGDTLWIKLLKPTSFSPIIAAIGIICILTSKGESKKKDVGGISLGFAILMFGMHAMSSAVAGLSDVPAFTSLMTKFSNPIIGMAVGAILTAIIQSSSASVGILQALCITGSVNYSTALPIIMGQNIGTCVTSIISSVGANKNAKRASMVHLLFNVIGTLIFFIVYLLLKYIISPQILSEPASLLGIAMFHTIFNVCTVVLMLPLTNALVSLVCKIIPETKTVDPDAPHLYFIDTNMLKTPPVAVQQTKAEIVNMAGIAIKNFNRSLDIICKLDFSKEEEFRKHEIELDFLNTALIDFIVKLSAEPALSEKDHLNLATTYRTVRDLERIGDYAENIVEYATSLKNVEMNFSPLALREIASLKATINELYSAVIQAYKYEDMEALETAEALEQQVDVITKHMEDNHISRLAEGVCTPEVGAHYLSLSTNTERVGDHLMNVGKSIRRLVPKTRNRR